MIYCAIDMFAIGQAIRILDGNNTTSVYAITRDVPATIASLCQEKNIYRVHFYGNEGYLRKIIEETETTYNLNYSNERPLEIEVN